MGDPHKDGSWGERRRRSGLLLAAAAIAVGGIGVAGVALAGPTTSTLPVITTKATTSTTTSTTRPTTTTTAAPVSCSSFPPSRITEDYYLNILGITSAGTTSGLGASYDPISDWSLTGSSQSSASNASGAGSRIVVGPLHLSLLKSNDGVALFSYFASRRHLATVTITTTPCGGGAAEFLVLSDVMVSGFATSSTQSANGGLEDAIELTYVKLVITRSQLDSNLRTWTTPVSSSYDLSSGRAA